MVLINDYKQLTKLFMIAVDIKVTSRELHHRAKRYYAKITHRDAIYAS